LQNENNIKVKMNASRTHKKRKRFNGDKNETQIIKNC